MTAVPGDTRGELIEKAARVLYDAHRKHGPHWTQIVDNAKEAYRQQARLLAAAGYLAEPGLRAELERVRGQLAEAVEMVKTCTGHPDRANPEIPSHPELLQQAHAERDALMEEIQGYQGDGAYEKGWEHGSATAAKFRAERDERQARLDKALALHREFKIYEPCGHDHDDGEAGTDFFAEVGNVCEDGYRYSICGFCCTDGSEQHEVCADHHMPEEKPNLCWPCQTRRVLKGEPLATWPVPASGEAEEARHDGGES